ncbi:hypothetical protein RJ639_021665 [Escallonia herrerae]|uniref:Uncharacterized protein n=1 Tax=Escallonia herrerae TaxID=1293975 RepID=A0AA88V2N3_9ASTE|nr:hypothetical protein RJ639_021665 [Escallonia herrerae]
MKKKEKGKGGDSYGVELSWGDERTEGRKGRKKRVGGELAMGATSARRDADRKAKVVAALVGGRCMEKWIKIRAGKKWQGMGLVGRIRINLLKNQKA